MLKVLPEKFSGRLLTQIAGALTVCAMVMGSCKELSQTFEESNAEMEAHRIGGPKVTEEEPSPLLGTEAVESEKKDDGLTPVGLKPGSVESRLHAEIVKRIRCSEPECSQDVLTRIRKNLEHFGPALKQLLTGQSPGVTLEAVRIAGLLGVDMVAPEVGAIAIKSPGELRAEAVWTLGNLGGKVAVTQLRRLASVGMNREIQEKTCQAYSRIKRVDAIPDIIELLRSDSSTVRAQCAIALGLTKSDSAVKPLKSLLSDESSDVKRAAKRALAAVGSPAAKKAFLGK